jgi:hypothetical protein
MQKSKLKLSVKNEVFTIQTVFDNEKLSQYERNYGLTLNKFYTVKEVMEFIPMISHKQLLRLIKSRVIAGHKISGRYVVQGWVLKRYLDSRIV